eukprot:jgi/Galph1/5174/GphlegSOOS_G3851.1
MESQPTSDLENYASRYSGRGKILRLQHIALHSNDLRQEALTLALAETKNTTRDVELYKKLYEQIKESGETTIAEDKEWETAVLQEDSKEIERLEAELQRYRHNMIKDSIRMAYRDLGDFQYSRGNLEEALKNYLKMRDYCMNAQQITDMCLKVIQCAIELKNFALVESYVQKAEQTPEISNDEKTLAKLRCAAGLAYLSKNKLNLAARKFLEIPFAIQQSFKQVIAPEDISTYGVISALATFSRKELKQKLLDNKGFRDFLELTPSMRDMIYDFYYSRYEKFFDRLRRIEPELKLDIYFFPLVDMTMELVRDKALIQYVTPYTSVHLQGMAHVFHTNIDSLQEELAKLIATNQIQARIDAHRKILFAKKTDKRDVSFSTTRLQGWHIVTEAECILLHMKMLKNNLCVRPLNASNRLDQSPHITDEIEPSNSFNNQQLGEFSS